MKSEIKKLAKSEVEITVEVAAEELKPFLEKAAEKISQKIKIEGFRPGKAPYDIVKQKAGEMAILEEALDSIIVKTYYQALKENNFVSIGQPKVEVEKLAPENPFVYKATVAIMPSIKIGDLTKIKVKRQPIEVKPEEVSQVIGDIQKMRATETLVARAAQKGDKLEIDFDVFMDQVPIDHGQQKKYPITIGENRFIFGFEEQLIGLKAGETKEFELNFPEKYYQKNLAGKKAEFKVVCNAVFEINRPEINDEFAKNVSGGQFKNVGEMKENVKTNLEKEKAQKEDQRLEVEIFDKIIAASEFGELPDILVSGEAHKIIHEIEHNIENQGLKFTDYLKSLNKTEEELEKELMPEAEKRVKASLVAREVYQAQKFEVSAEEVRKETNELIKNYPANPEMSRQFESEAYQEYLKNSIGNRKVAEYLKKIIIQ